MGFFAVVHHGKEEFTVETCHINLWSLPGIGRQIFYWDVGLHIRAGSDEDVSKIELALPFATGKKSLEDLHVQMLSTSIGTLIFGKHVVIDTTPGTPGKITIKRPDGDWIWPLTSLKPSGCVQDSDFEMDTFSFWTLELSNPVRRGEYAYLRVRFRTSKMGRTWVSKRNTGAIVDLRIADVRESSRVKGSDQFRQRIVPIKKLFLFLIVPASLQYKHASPEIHDLRLLEGTVWEDYLKRKSDRKRKAKYVIYQWRNKQTATDDAVDEANAFRAFIDLSPETQPLSLRRRMITVLVAMIVIWLCIRVGFSPDTDKLAVISAAGTVVDYTFRTAIAAGIGGVLSIVIGLLEKVKKIRDWWEGFLPQLEDQYYKP